MFQIFNSIVGLDLYHFAYVGTPTVPKPEVVQKQKATSVNHLFDKVSIYRYLALSILAHWK